MAEALAIVAARVAGVRRLVFGCRLPPGTGKDNATEDAGQGSGHPPATLPLTVAYSLHQLWQKNKRTAPRWIYLRMNVVRDGRKPAPFPGMNKLRINKRNQLRRDKVCGLRRVELKINAQAVDALNRLADQRAMSRSELIELILLAEFERQRPAG